MDIEEWVEKQAATCALSREELRQFVREFLSLQITTLELSSMLMIEIIPEINEEKKMEIADMFKEIRTNFTYEIETKTLWGQREILLTHEKIMRKTLEKFIAEVEASNNHILLPNEPKPVAVY